VAARKVAAQSLLTLLITRHVGCRQDLCSTSSVLSQGQLLPKVHCCKPAAPCVVLPLHATSLALPQVQVVPSPAQPSCAAVREWEGACVHRHCDRWPPCFTSRWWLLQLVGETGATSLHAASSAWALGWHKCGGWVRGVRAASTGCECCSLRRDPLRACCSSVGHIC
jgi:hypothetical protein